MLVPLTIGAVVALSAGLLARHEPRSKGYFRLFFSDPIHLKAGFATTAAVLACFQLFTALDLRKLPWTKPAWVNAVHRWSGRLAFAFTLPVAYHCIFKLGFQDPDARVLAHSLLGCAVYGAFAAKVTILRLHRFPAPVLPVAGGLLFATLIGVWYTSALWLYRQPHPPAAAASPIPAAASPAAGRRSVQVRRMRFLPHAGGRRLAGQIGPNLDTLRPSFAAVQTQVERGGGGMPSFSSQLTPRRSVMSRRSSPRARAAEPFRRLLGGV